MPVYGYKCHTCLITWEEINSVENRNSENCSSCGAPAEIQISNTARPVIYEYYDDGLGQNVTGPKHRGRLMRERDLEAK